MCPSFGHCFFNACFYTLYCTSELKRRIIKTRKKRSRLKTAFRVMWEFFCTAVYTLYLSSISLIFAPFGVIVLAFISLGNTTIFCLGRSVQGTISHLKDQLIEFKLSDLLFKKFQAELHTQTFEKEKIDAQIFNCINAMIQNNSEEDYPLNQAEMAEKLKTLSADRHLLSKQIPDDEKLSDNSLIRADPVIRAVFSAIESVINDLKGRPEDTLALFNIKNNFFDDLRISFQNASGASYPASHNTTNKITPAFTPGGGSTPLLPEPIPADPTATGMAFSSAKPKSK